VVGELRVVEGCRDAAVQHDAEHAATWVGRPGAGYFVSQSLQSCSRRNASGERT
jgi:hypothetical protein